METDQENSKPSSKRRWRKILYEDQGVPDNYVDETFLVEMKKNLYTRTYKFWPVVKESGVVTQQVSCVCLFVVTFIYMDDKKLPPEVLIACLVALGIIGYIVNEVLQKNEPHTRTKWDDMKSLIIFVAFGYGLSPILMSLTETVSTDSIYAMTAFTLLANLLFHDYGTEAAMVSQALSLNAAIFAAVCLASRLPTTLHAFATLAFAVELFALWPSVRRRLKTNMPSSQVIMTVLLGMLAILALVSVSRVGAVLFFLLHIFITFICPAWLIRMQPYKNNIYGPWDEATIKE